MELFPMAIVQQLLNDHVLQVRPATSVKPFRQGDRSGGATICQRALQHHPVRADEGPDFSVRRAQQPLKLIPVPVAGVGPAAKE